MTTVEVKRKWKTERNKYGDVVRLSSEIVEEIPDWFHLSAVAACNCYEAKTARELKARMRDDLAECPSAAIEKWRPFVENTLGGKR